MPTGLTRHLLASLIALLALAGCSGGGGGQFPPETWVVSATADAGGSIDPASQSVEDGAAAKLTVTPDSGYAIAKVTGCNGTLDGNTYATDAVTASCQVSATFTPESAPVLYDIGVIAAPAAGGRVSGGGTYGEGQAVTVVATASGGYEFVDWTENGTPVSTEATYSFNAASARNLSANFRIRSYSVTATASAGGSITPASRTVEHGSTASFTLTPDTGFSIAGVSGCNGTFSADTYTTGPVTGACRVDATFTRGPSPVLYDVNVSSSSAGGGVSGGGTYADGSQVTVSATPYAGFDFVSWTENEDPISTSAAYTFYAAGDRALTANFAIHSYGVTATAGAGGVIDPGSRSVEYGSTAQFTVTPDTNYSIAGVSGCGGTLEGTSYTTGEITGECTVEASFTEGPAPVLYDVAVMGSPFGGGVLDGAGTYGDGAQVTLNATANAGYEFANWSEGGSPVSTSATYSFAAAADRNLVANFNVRTYRVTASTGTGGTVDATSRTVEHRATATFVLTPDANYSIGSVIGCGGRLDGNTYTTAPVTADCEVIASFAVGPTNQSYDITVAASPVEAGVVSGGGSYTSAAAPAGPPGLPTGADVTVSATANEGYQFVNWTENGNPVSTSASYTFTTTGDRNLVANFGVRTYGVTAVSGAGGTLTPTSQSVEHGATASITVTPETGYSIDKVAGCGGKLAGNTFTTDAIFAACEVTASFVLNSYPVTAIAGSHGTIDPPERSVDHGAVTSFTVTPDTGYHVDTIAGCGGNLDLDIFTTDQITGPCSVNAAFAINTYTVTATAGTGGTVDAVSRTVEHGATATFTLTPDSGYGIAEVSGCGGTRTGDIYTTGEMTADCEVVALFAPLRTIGGTLSGLGENASLTLRNGGDELILSADGPFTFSIPVIDGGSYDVLIANQPEGRVCDVVAGAGVVNNADVTGIAVNCPPPAPAVSLTYGIKELRFAWNGVNGATHYKLFEDPDGASGYIQIGLDLTTTDVGHEIALYDRLNARYRVEACNDYGCTGSDEIFMADGLLAAIGYLKGANTEAGDEFGASIALSADGSTLAIGAYKEDSAGKGVGADPADNAGYNSGAVYVFARTATGWSQQAYLKSSNSEGSSISVGFGDFFGYSVALSGDGNTLAVGSRFEDSAATGVNGDGASNLAASSGAVYVFTRSGTAWSEQAYIKASNTDRNDSFGGGNELTGDLALSASGDTLVVGAIGEGSAATGVDGDQTDNSASYGGAAYVFSRSGPTWMQKAYLKASNTGAGDRFGEAVAISGDGNTIAVGAPYEASTSTGVDGADNDLAAESGAVYLFTRAKTNKWSQQAYIKASNTGSVDHFGTCVGLSDDGATLAVGAPGEDSAAIGIDGDGSDDSMGDSGAVYLFTRSTTGWAQQAYLKASNAGGNFGNYLAISSDGNRLAIGAPRERVMATGINGEPTSSFEFSSGAAYLFTRTGMVWSEQAYIKAPNTDSGDLFATVALSGDGNTLAVGAPLEDSAANGLGGDPVDNTASAAGAAYLY